MLDSLTPERKAELKKFAYLVVAGIVSSVAATWITVKVLNVRGK